MMGIVLKLRDVGEDGGRLLLADDVHRAGADAGVLVVGNGLHAGAQRAVDVEDAAAHERAAGDLDHRLVEARPLLLAQRVLGVSKEVRHGEAPERYGRSAAAPQRADGEGLGARAGRGGWHAVDDALGLKQDRGRRRRSRSGGGGRSSTLGGTCARGLPGSGPRRRAWRSGPPAPRRGGGSCGRPRRRAPSPRRRGAGRSRGPPGGRRPERRPRTR